MSIIYSEEIGFSGILKVEEDHWYIQYYFSGPDGRYNGVHVVIPGQEVDDYINAWELNYKEYQKLKIEYSGRRYEKKTLKGMNIKIGEFWEGVCFTKNHMPINTQRKLKKVIDSLTYAKAKSKSVYN